MVRLKFAFFALVALAVAGYHLIAVSPPVSARAQILASETARTAAAAARGEVARQKEALVTAALAARTSPEVLQVLASPAAAKASLPAEERLDLLRAAFFAALPEGLRGEVKLGLTQDSGAALAGVETAAAPAEGAEIAALASLPAEVLLHGIGGEPHLLTSMSLAPAPGRLVVAVPLVVQSLGSVATAGGTLGVAILEGGRVVASAGPIPAEELERELATTRAGMASVVRRGASASLGPVSLPLFTDGAAGAAQTALRTGYRVEAGPGLEAAAVVDLSSFHAGLANGQRQTLIALGGLLALTLVWTVLMGSGAKRSREDEEEAGSDTPLRASLSVLPLVPPAPREPTPTPGPDDFQFGGGSPAPAEEDPAQALAAGGGWTPAPSPAAAAFAPSEPEPAYEAPAYEAPAYEPPAYEAPAYAAASQAEPPRGFADAPASSFGGGGSPYAAPFQGLPPPVAAPDPFGMVPQGSPDDSYYGDDNPDATRVAAVPAELLQASAYAMPASPSPFASQPFGGIPAVAPQVNDADSEEQHFHDVFQDFVATRARCGESADGLTYDKFVAKLRKNREQLVQKYSCRTVRFQVYVKEGKAALKATPVKD